MIRTLASTENPLFSQRSIGDAEVERLIDAYVTAAVDAEAAGFDMVDIKACTRLLVGVRLSLFDTVPWHMVEGRGAPFPFADSLPYDCGFGVDEDDPTRIDLAEPIALLKVLRDLGVVAVNLSAGCPYAVPHVTRPAAYKALPEAAEMKAIKART